MLTKRQAKFAWALIIFGHIWVPLQAQQSVARMWNEVLLQAIRGDFARPTVHARNLFHISIAMYDSWAVQDDQANTYFLGKNLQGFVWPFEGVTPSSNKQAAREETMSYAAYRLIKYRFRFSPGSFYTDQLADSLMEVLGYDPGIVSTDYQTDDPAALGNYLAAGIIAYGLQDGSNEINQYGNLFYEPLNPGLDPTLPGNPDLIDPNRWQPLKLAIFIDQSGNPVDSKGLPFLSPEWGIVHPFALKESDKQIYQRDGNSYIVYHDPGVPSLMEDGAASEGSKAYQWGFELVGIWSSHLDPADSVMWDISPTRIGNVQSYPSTFEEYQDFYDLIEGGDASIGHALNPVTGLPYPPNMVPRADYTRVLAEFWADGPESETPPGHWFSILNYVSDHPLFARKLQGEGEAVDALEWDVKAYFTLGRALHDCAITAWGIKGYYDYLRPVSALRWMADRGQRSDPSLENYDPQGLQLIPGLIEVVTVGDPLAGDSSEHVGKIKINAWRGPDYIDSAAIDMAGVGWILVDNWWPYQRPTFVTPPFAGYISGHSTFSRAGAEVLTQLTGDPFFPGGVGEFFAHKNEFLVFEEGPSQDVVLQWATYQDASDQTSLSRIWGGIHPPIDDIPGRKIGKLIGEEAVALALSYFSGTAGKVAFPDIAVSPNPAGLNSPLSIGINQAFESGRIKIHTLLGQEVYHYELPGPAPYLLETIRPSFVVPGLYLLSVETDQWSSVTKVLISD